MIDFKVLFVSMWFVVNSGKIPNIPFASLDTLDKLLSAGDYTINHFNNDLICTMYKLIL